MLKEITEKLIMDVTALLPGISLLLSPSITLPDEAFVDLPKLVFQGPELGKRMIDYTVRNTPKEVVDGVQVYEQRFAEIETSLVFRLRYFDDSLINTLKQIEKLAGRDYCGADTWTSHEITINKLQWLTLNGPYCRILTFVVS